MLITWGVNDSNINGHLAVYIVLASPRVKSEKGSEGKLNQCKNNLPHCLQWNHENVTHGIAFNMASWSRE